MKNLIRSAFLLMFVCAGIGLMMPRGAAAGNGEAETVSQASLYRRHCASCHGVDGRANTAKGRETDADDLTTEKVQNMAHDRIVSVIRNGKGDMPSFKNKMTAAQIASVAKHVKAF